MNSDILFYFKDNETMCPAEQILFYSNTFYNILDYLSYDFNYIAPEHLYTTNHILISAFEIFIFSSVISFALFFSFVFIAYCFYKPMKNTFIQLYKNNHKLYEFDKFLFLYLDSFNKLNTRNLEQTFLKQLKNKYIKYNTSYGDIILYYDFNNESFNYYSKDSYSIPFNYLDVISRIYVVLYDSKNIYIDNFDNIKSSSPSTTPPSSPKSNNTDISNNKNSIFYSNPNSKSNSYSNSNSNSKSYSNNKEIFNYQSNKYKYKGTIQTFIKKINNFQIYLVNDIIDDLDNEYDTLHDISIISLQDNTLYNKLDLSYNYITDNLPLHNIIFSIKKKTSEINLYDFINLSSDISTDDNNDDDDDDDNDDNDDDDDDDDENENVPNLYTDSSNNHLQHLQDKSSKNTKIFISPNNSNSNSNSNLSFKAFKNNILSKNNL